MRYPLAERCVGSVLEARDHRTCRHCGLPHIAACGVQLGRQRRVQPPMKVVLTQTEGAPHFALLDDLEVDGLQIVRVSTPEELATEIRDADVLYGFPTTDLLRAAESLRWIQSPSAGVNYLQD